MNNVGVSHYRTGPVDQQPVEVTRQSVTVVAPALVEQRASANTCQQAATARSVRQYHREPERPAFDFHFVSSDQQVRTLLHSLTQDGDVVLINQPEQLFQDDLVQCLHIGADGQYRQKPGRLFIGDLTLVIDSRPLSCDELPTFNDLLDPDRPSAFDKLTGVKRALGSHIKVLVLAQLEQLQAETSGIKAPGADFWRRVNRPGNCWQPPEPPNRPDALLAEYRNNTDENSVTINCHMHASWRRLLFGGPGIDDKGRISHIPGQLAQLQHGQHVILKGANWQDLTFEQAIRQLITHRQYRENGEPQRLADNVTFYRMPVASDELSQLWQATLSNITDQASGQNHILINQANIAQWLNPFGISPAGVAITNNILSEQIRAGATLSVTSPLSEALWFQLLGAVERCKDCTGRSLQKLAAISARQPQSLVTELAKTRFTPPPLAFKMVTFRQEAEANAWLEAWDDKPLIIQISPLTTFGQLFDQLHIISEQKVQFGRQQTELQQALAEGKPVVLRGLDSNPALQQALEPLLCAQPLPLNGTLSTYPDADLTVLWPAQANSASPLLTAARALPCPELDIWSHCAAQHGLTRSQLPEQAINKLYEASHTIPSSLCPPLPALSKQLLDSLIRTALQAQKHDNSPTLQAHHWRRAIDSVLTHSTRTHSAARDYMKVTCQQLLPEPQDWVDPGRLQQLLDSAPTLHQQFVVKHLWSLARCFGPGVLSHCQLHLLPFSPPNFLDSDALDTFCSLIVSHSVPALQQAIAEQLEVASGLTDQSLQLNIRPSAQIRRLQDALAGGWRLKAAHNHQQAVAALAAQCFVIARAAADNAVTLISERLTHALTWQGSAAAPLLALADDLYHSRTSQADCLARRLSRLHQRMAHAPVIFLQGETGTGKSYFAATVANTSGPAFIASLGPYDSEQTLAKRWCWQENDNDRGMTEKNQVLMTWANTKGTNNDHYVTLVLDEGNLAADGLLSALTGLWQPTPCVYVNGHPVSVSTKHRVIITGNPDNYNNRQTEPTLKAKIPCIHYPRLKKEFLDELVIKPALGQFIPESIAATADAILALWQHYPQLLPDRLFTPRDLQDICAWAGWYLKQASTTEPTQEQLHGVVLQCFRDLLNPQITATDGANALESWFGARHATDFALVKQVHDRILAPACRAFITLASDVKPAFDTSPAAVIELVHQLSQDLHRCQQSFHHHRAHGGRQATIIEGPPGRGKDVTLQLLLQSVEQQVIARGETMPAVYYLNACDCAWDDLRNIIKQARMHGGIVVVAELNMIDSQYLEGELNDTLSGDAHPGFHLFATVNPSHYGGRKALSPALTARFRHLPIRAYNLNELQAIVSKALPANKHAQAAILACWHCRVRRALHNKNLPLLPTSLDLQKAATAINSGEDFSQSVLEETFKQHYQLYLLALRSTLEQLPQLPVATTASTIDTALCDWLHRVLPCTAGPWLIKRHGRNQLLERQRTICLKFSLTMHEAQQTIITMLAQAQWQAANLPLTPPPTDPVLTQAFYRLWQQRWFVHHFQHTGIAPDTVFPITTAQRELLATANQQHLEQITRLVNDFGQYSSYHWLTVKTRLNQRSADDLPTASNNDYVDVYKPEASGQETDLLPAQTNRYPLSTRLLNSTGNLLLAPIAWTYKLAQLLARTIHKYWRLPLPARLVDRRTDYEEQPVRQWQLTQHFNSHHLPSQYRLECKDLSVRPDGEIIIRDFPAMDVEVDMPAKVTGRQQVVGKIRLIPVDGLCLLPGLTPDEDIVEMHTVPSVQYRLSRDQYSGLHRVRVPASNQRVTFTYTVQAREGHDHNPRQPLDVHCSQPMKLAIETLFAHMDEYSQHQRDQLLAITEATTTEQRIDAITHYCQQFSGRTKPTTGQHLFLFLLQQQQGSCRHRTVVFVALCRYFAIPARIICNSCHAFVEFSLNQTWQSQDLGGSPGPAEIVVPDFSPAHERTALAWPETDLSISTNDSRQPDQSGLSAQAEMLISVFNHASNEEQACLAKAIDVSTDSLLQGACEGSPLTGVNSPTAVVIKALWEQGSLAALSLGLTLLKSRDLLDHMNKRVINSMIFNTFPKKTLIGTLQKLLSCDVDTDQFMQLLSDIYTTTIVSNDNVRPVLWHNMLVSVLSTSDLTSPAAVILTHEAFESGWIDLEHKISLSSKTFSVNASKLFWLLKKLGEYEELKDLSDNYLNRWYHHFLRPRGIQCTECHSSSCLKDQKATMLISHSLSGHSLQLDSWLTTSTLQSAWSDEPEGIPDIGRLLARLPAYRRTLSGQNQRRPVIIISDPLWYVADIKHKADILMHKKLASDPKLSTVAIGMQKYDFLFREMNTKINEIKEKGGKSSKDCRTRVEDEYTNIIEPFVPAKEQSKALLDTAIRLLMQQFSQYFFQKTATKGNRLHFCWFDGDTDAHLIGFGSHQPSSPEELFAMFTQINQQDFHRLDLDHKLLNQVLNTSNGLVLDSSDISTIAEEYLSSVDLDLICNHWQV